MTATLTILSLIGNYTVKHVDLGKYEGKWYVIGFKPTIFDRNWNYTTETYTLNAEGNYDIVTTWRKTEEGKHHMIRSKGFIDKSSGNSKWKVQFFWPFKADYWIIELDDEYKYAVVGNRKKSFLYILCRNTTMSDKLYAAILERCRNKGYDVSKVRKQLQ